MGIGSPFITRRTAAATQTVIDQVEPQRPYEAATPGAAPEVKGDSANTAKAVPIERLGIR